MNDFTKEELQYLHECVYERPNSVTPKMEEMRDKIKSMIDNYCDNPWKACIKPTESIQEIEGVQDLRGWIEVITKNIQPIIKGDSKKDNDKINIIKYSLDMLVNSILVEFANPFRETKLSDQLNENYQYGIWITIAKRTK